MESIIKGFKVRLIPTEEQKTYFEKASGTARWVYNWALNRKLEEYYTNQNNISSNDLGKELTVLKNTTHPWISEVAYAGSQVAIRDLDKAFLNFYKGRAQEPKFKTKRKSKKSFYCSNIKFTKENKGVHIEKLGVVQLGNDAKRSNLYYLTLNKKTILNARVSFDGVYWYLSFVVEIPKQKVNLTQEIIGIDLGIKDTAICSNGITYKNINKGVDIKKLEKRKKRLQRQLSRKYEMNKQGNKYVKTKNIIKLEKKILKLDRHISNIRNNYNHHISSEIVKTKPSMIVIENLNIKGMMKNRHLSKAIQQQLLYGLTQMIKYKAEWQGTKFHQVSRNYKSTQTCSDCNHTQKMPLNKRVYECPICGLSLDRDLNASYNLRNQGRLLLAQA